MKYVCGGNLDYGAFYAANSFFDPVSQSQIVHGWILEEDLPDKLREQQGWSGLISLPRKLSMTTIENVDQSCIDSLHHVPGFACEPGNHRSWTVTTLSIMPDPRIRLLRGPKISSSKASSETTFTRQPSIVFPHGLSHFELQASFQVDASAAELGLHFFHSSGNYISISVLML